MELRLGYFPVLDAALVLRQAFESVRFQPFAPAMEVLAGRFTAAEKAALEAVGEATGGWLRVLEALMDPGTAGLLGSEEGLLRLEEAAAADPRSAAWPLLAQVVRTGIAPEASRRARHLLDATAAIGRGVREAGAWNYLLGLSDRFYRAKSGEFVFRIKPELRVREEEVERLIITPSLVASRRLTFWKRGGTVLFYLSSSLPGVPGEPPDGLLLSALAVGDRTRLRMLRRLADHPCTNLEMAEFLGVNPSTASRHFKLFKDAGFVELREGEGGRMEYELSPESLARALEAIVAFIQGGGK
ncbi:MAG TPA: helix-turn-helix domain-containing protein [Holophaga sp.]|nr:helix-turn-helix domain-containing protein [Holophaga sp.]HPS67324.1 helix-turn-helix domain-containing protein [Holophaga sp.]